MIDNRSASLANALLGAWLLVSAFLWHHSKTNFVNAWSIGLVVVASSLMAIRVPWFRFVTAAAGLWLITGLFRRGPARGRHCLAQRHGRARHRARFNGRPPAGLALFEAGRIQSLTVTPSSGAARPGS